MRLAVVLPQPRRGAFQYFPELAASGLALLKGAA